MTDHSPVSHQNSPQIDLCRTDHVPDGDAPVLAAGHHHPVLEVEAEMEDGLAVVDESVDHLPSLHVPDPDGAVRGAGDDDLVVVLQAEDGAGVACEDLAVLLQCLSVPHLDGVVPQTADNLAVVVLQAVDSLAVLTPAVYPLQVVLPAPPVVLDGLRWKI